MSFETEERAVLDALKAKTGNPHLKANDIEEWSYQPLKPMAGERIIELEKPRVFVAYRPKQNVWNMSNQQR